MKKIIKNRAVLQSFKSGILLVLLVSFSKCDGGKEITCVYENGKLFLKDNDLLFGNVNITYGARSLKFMSNNDTIYLKDSVINKKNEEEIQAVYINVKIVERGQIEKIIDVYTFDLVFERDTVIRTLPLRI